ncbi:type VII secretion protein EccE [Auraticoccus monumenti]|uniref:Type VII secretion protein EccE n=1 Tax=Auraticoccus monumenti TaxID=675864 RepID=A0A1G6SLB1_9ACTN|nr:type VII secretion protein EccE [Auraticoccus monumenti]SDD16915.1 type VII secretion protein EccE [Auraticoccus monumenti]
MARTTSATVALAPRRPRLLSRLGPFVVAELLLLLAVLAALTGTVAGYVVAGVLVLLLVVLVVPFGGRSLVQRVRLRLAYSRRSPQTAADTDVPHDLVPLAQWVPGLSVSQTVTGRGEEVGVITDGSAWTAVLALDADDELIADSGEELSLRELADLTVQDDVVFAGVQVVTYTVPAPSRLLLGEDSAAARAYLEIARTVPPTVQRTWLCVRLDPRLCLEAVARRGLDNDGIYATLRFGLHRVQSVLKRQGIETRALTPLEIHEVLALTSGSGPDGGDVRTRESWQHWECDGLLHSGRAVQQWGSSATLGYGRLLQAVAQAPVLFAVTSYVLAPGREASGGIRLVTPNAALAQVGVDTVTAALGRDVRLAPAGGVQVPTMLATVPLGRGVAA